MSTPESGLRRVAVHTGTHHADLSLPADMPVAALIAAVVDIMGVTSAVPRPHRLGLPGRAPLDNAKTLAQQGIRDGSVLVLSSADDIAPAPRFDDPAAQVAATVAATAHLWTPVARRLAGALAASGLAGVAGFVAVPGGPGTPNAWLAVAAAGTAAVLAVPASGCSGPARAMLCCLAGLAVLAAVAGMACAATGISVQAVGAVTAAGAAGLIRVAGRVAIRVAAPAARDAHDLLTGLVAASTAAVLLGVGGVAAGNPVDGAPRPVGVTFAAAAGAVLLLRARCHADGRQIAALVAGGAAALGIAVLTLGGGPWPAGAAVSLAGAALVAGFAAPAERPWARRGAELLEAAALGSLAPLACWLCGLYGAARGLSLG